MRGNRVCDGEREHIGRGGEGVIVVGGFEDKT